MMGQLSLGSPLARESELALVCPVVVQFHYSSSHSPSNPLCFGMTSGPHEPLALHLLLLLLPMNLMLNTFLHL